MQFKKISPSPSLRSVVKYYWLLEYNSATALSQTLFPFDSFELIFNLNNGPQLKLNEHADHINTTNSLFAGQFTKPFFLKYSAGHRSVGISLQPWAGNVLFDISAQQFTNRITAFEDLDVHSGLFEKLSNSAGETECIRHLETYLIKRIKTVHTDPLSSAIAQAIQHSDAQFQEVMGKSGYSKRRLEQRFLVASGLSMGTFLRKIRFQKAVHILRSSRHDLLTRVALDAGYYDQSHFNREFKEFSGVAPKVFLNVIKNDTGNLDMKEVLIFDSVS